MEKLNGERLQRVIILRVIEEDYQTLSEFTINQKWDVSRLMRNLKRAALDMVKENNAKK